MISDADGMMTSWYVMQAPRHRVVPKDSTRRYVQSVGRAKHHAVRPAPDAPEVPAITPEDYDTVKGLLMKKHFTRLAVLEEQERLAAEEAARQAEFWRVYSAATRIQAWVRGCQCRRRLEEIRLWEEYLARCATRIQAAWLGYRTYTWYNSLAKPSHHRAALHIQRVYRGLLARRTVIAIRYSRAATRIQAAWRGVLSRRVVQQLRIRMKRKIQAGSAALTIQTAYRGYAVRKKYRELLLLQLAAVNIQRVMRGFLARRERLRILILRSVPRGPEKFRACVKRFEMLQAWYKRVLGEGARLEREVSDLQLRRNESRKAWHRERIVFEKADEAQKDLEKVIEWHKALIDNEELIEKLALMIKDFKGKVLKRGRVTDELPNELFRATFAGTKKWARKLKPNHRYEAGSMLRNVYRAAFDKVDMLTNPASIARELDLELRLMLAQHPITIMRLQSERQALKERADAYKAKFESLCDEYYAAYGALVRKGRGIVFVMQRVEQALAEAADADDFSEPQMKRLMEDNKRIVRHQGNAAFAAMIKTLLDRYSKAMHRAMNDATLTMTAIYERGLIPFLAGISSQRALRRDNIKALNAQVGPDGVKKLLGPMAPGGIMDGGLAHSNPRPNLHRDVVETISSMERKALKAAAAHVDEATMNRMLGLSGDAGGGVAAALAALEDQDPAEAAAARQEHEFSSFEAAMKSHGAAPRRPSAARQRGGGGGKGRRSSSPPRPGSKDSLTGRRLDGGGGDDDDDDASSVSTFASDYGAGKGYFQRRAHNIRALLAHPLSSTGKIGSLKVLLERADMAGYDLTTLREGPAHGGGGADSNSVKHGGRATAANTSVSGKFTVNAASVKSGSLFAALGKDSEGTKDGAATTATGVSGGGGSKAKAKGKVPFMTAHSTPLGMAIPSVNAPLIGDARRTVSTHPLASMMHLISAPPVGPAEGGKTVGYAEQAAAEAARAGTAVDAAARRRARIGSAASRRSASRASETDATSGAESEVTEPPPVNTPEWDMYRRRTTRRSRRSLGSRLAASRGGSASPEGLPPLPGGGDGSGYSPMPSRPASAALTAGGTRPASALRDPSRPSLALASGGGVGFDLHPPASPMLSAAATPSAPASAGGSSTRRARLLAPLGSPPAAVAAVDSPTPATALVSPGGKGGRGAGGLPAITSPAPAPAPAGPSATVAGGLAAAYARVKGRSRDPYEVGGIVPEGDEPDEPEPSAVTVPARLRDAPFIGPEERAGLVAEEEVSASLAHRFPIDPYAYSVEDVGWWLMSVGMGRYRSQFVAAGISGERLLQLEGKDVQYICGVKDWHHVQRILQAREVLRLRTPFAVAHPRDPDDDKLTYPARCPPAPTVLKWIKAGRLADVTSAVRHGYNFTAEDDHGNTPLFIAAIFGHRRLVDLFVSRGADVNHQNRDGNTVLHFVSDPSIKPRADPDGGLARYFELHGAFKTLLNKYGLEPAEGCGFHLGARRPIV